MIEKQGAGPKVRVGLTFTSFYVTDTWEDAIQFADGVGRIAREREELPWQAVVDRARLASKDLPISTLEAHDEAPYVYWGVCSFKCKRAALMLKMQVRAFEKFGHYMCTQCGLVFESGDTPEPLERKWRRYLGMPS